MLAYVVALYLAEAIWCSVGLRRLRDRADDPRLLPALSFGLVRLLTGRAMALLTQDHLGAIPDWAIYAFVLLPCRWLAWSLIADLIAAGRLHFRIVFAGTRVSNQWKVRGTLLCCAADLFALFGGVWVDHFWP